VRHAFNIVIFTKTIQKAAESSRHGTTASLEPGRGRGHRWITAQRQLVQHSRRRSNKNDKEAATGVPYASTPAAADAATRRPFTRCAIAQLLIVMLVSVAVVRVEEVSVVVWGVVLLVSVVVLLAVVV